MNQIKPSNLNRLDGNKISIVEIEVMLNQRKNIGIMENNLGQANQELRIEIHKTLFIKPEIIGDGKDFGAALHMHVFPLFPNLLYWFFETAARDRDYIFQ